MESYSALAASYDELTQDVGSVLDGEEAVSSGLIDRLGGLSDALDYLHRRIAEK